MLITYHKLGLHRQAPRIWLENHRLHQLGFTARTQLSVTPGLDGGINLRTATGKTPHRVSSRFVANIACPVIDINSATSLAALCGFSEAKVTASQGLIQVTPSRRAIHIKKHLTTPRWETLELAAGGGTMSEAICSDPRFHLAYGLEIDKRYSSVWAHNHPDTCLIQADMRLFDPEDIPPMAYIHASLPCTCFSHAGVAKKGLKGQNELGDSGDLYLDYLRIVKAHMPLATTVENVPAFFTSLAGLSLIDSLQKAGYFVTLINILPHAEWGEIQDRRRSLMVATLQGKFLPSIPMTPCQDLAGAYLDPEDPVQDKADADAIAASIAGRYAHQARHKAAGNRFGFKIINAASLKVPTILRSYYKINIGPFVETTYGPRLLRVTEVARLTGCNPDPFRAFNYPTSIQVMGQGVQTKIFKKIVAQLGDFLQFQTNKSWKS